MRAESAIMLLVLALLVIILVITMLEEHNEKETKWNRNTRTWTNITYFNDNYHLGFDRPKRESRRENFTIAQDGGDSKSHNSEFQTDTTRPGITGSGVSKTEGTRGSADSIKTTD